VYWWGTVHKRRPQSGGCPVRTRRGGGRVFRCGRPHFLAQKSLIFKIYGVSARTRGGIKPVRTRGRGSVFRDFVRTSFMDGP